MAPLAERAAAQRWRRRQIRRWRWLPLLLGIELVGAWLWLGSGSTIWTPIVDIDINQHRSNTVLPIPQGSTTLRQSFQPHWDGFGEVEIILARHQRADTEDNQDESGRFSLRLLDDDNQVVTEKSLNTRSLTHNQTYVLRFPPQPHSAGRTYILELSGNESNPVSVWGYNLNVYGGGRLVLRQGTAGEATTTAADLTFITRYHLTWSDAAAALGTMLARDGVLLLVALLLIPLPGCLLLLLGPRSWRSWDTAAWWGVAFAVGAAIWPLLWLGLTLIGGRVSGWLLWVLLTLGWVAAILLRQRHRKVEAPRSYSMSNRWHYALLLLLTLTAIAVRLLAVRNLNTPPWVDSSRHALITAVMAAGGQEIGRAHV